MPQPESLDPPPPPSQPSPRHHHDASYKLLFSHPELVEHPVSRDAIIDAIACLNLWVDEIPGLRHDANQWLQLSLSRLDNYTEGIKPAGTLKELSMSLHEKLVEWNEESRTEGRQEGRQEGLEQGLRKGLQTGQAEGLRQGAARALLALLNKRFGSQSEALQSRIHAATHLQIEAWFDRALDADSLSQVF